MKSLLRTGAAAEIARVVVIVALAACVVAWFIGSKPEPERREAGDSAPLVEVLEARAEATTMTVIGHGTVRAKTELPVTARVAGQVVFMAPLLREGAGFKRGQLLARIDPRPYELAVESLQAQVEQARVEIDRLKQEKVNAEAQLELSRGEVELTRREFERATRLFQTDSDSKAASDRAERAWLVSRLAERAITNRLALLPSSVSGAEARLRQLRAQLAESELQLEYTELKAPFDGRTLERHAEAEQQVSPGAVLARVYDNQVMEIPLRLPLEDFQWLDASGLAPAGLPGAASRNPPSDAPPKAEVRLRLPGVVHRWSGAVARVDARVDEATRTAGVFVEIPRTEWAEGCSSSTSALLPGMFVEVEIQGRALEATISLPRGAIDQDGNVRLLRDARLALSPVSVLRIVGDTAIIGAGVEDGDQVIISSIPAPVEGMRLRTMGTGQ